MAFETTYTKLRAELASILDKVSDDQETVIVRRRTRGGRSKDVALIPAEELSSLNETAYLLRSPANAERLLAAHRRSVSGKGKPRTVAWLRKELGLGEDE